MSAVEQKMQVPIEKSRCYKHFTKEEDIKLKDLVKQYENNWKEISLHLPGWNFRECRDRYLSYLVPRCNIPGS